MDAHSIPHRIERTRNKHSRAVFRGDTIVIRLAKNLTPHEEREHIESLSVRMRKLVEMERRKQCIDPFRPLLEGQQELTVRLGTGKRVCFQLLPAPKTSARRTQNGWTIGVSPQMRKAALHRLLWNIIATEEHASIDAMIHKINEDTLRVPLVTTTLRFATSQWGSCSPKGIIMLNTALLFLPPSLLHYVIVHELAHRRIAGHSDAYWAIVKHAMPRYERAYEALRKYRLPKA